MNAFYRFLITLFTCCLVVITMYWFVHGIKAIVVFYHLLLVGTGLTALLAFGFVLLRINSDSRLLILVYALSWSIFVGLIVLGYLLTFSGEAILNIPLPFPILWAYAGQFTNTVRSFGLSPWLVGLLFSLLPGGILTFTILFRTVLWTGTQHLTATTYYACQLLQKRLSAGFRVRLYTGMIIVTLLGLTIYKLYLASVTTRLQDAREPFFLVFYKSKMGGLSLSETAESPDIRANYPKKQPFNRKNVVLIIVDALRADYLPLYGYTQGQTPFLTKLAKTGYLHKVDYAFSSATSSFPGIMSILRSKTWPRIAVNSFALHDLLKDQGYGVNFILSGDHTNFFDIKSLYGKSVDRYFDGTHSDRHYFNDDQVLLEGLASFKPALSAPSFYYFHMMSVHPLGLRHTAYAHYLPADATGSATVRS